MVVTRAAVMKRWAISQCLWASLNLVTVYSRGLVRVQIKVMQPKIRAHEVGKTFETTSGMITALEKLSLDIGEGEFVCIVGPSGCGKSTFLRMLAGLSEVSSGTLTIDHDASSNKPLTSVVFQEYAIFPWKTVLHNVAFGLEMRGVNKKIRLETARVWLERVGLSKFANNYPRQLSGGMKQRVAIARALANDPDVLLMDEPLGALDAQTKAVLQEELLRLWEANRKTVVYITHSIDEAILLGDRVVVMTAHPGTLKTIFEVDIPRPRNLDTSRSQAFNELARAVWDALEDEVYKARAA